MICDKCKQREATYHSTVNINGNVSESHLCSECAISENKISNLFNVGKLFNTSMFDINTNLVSHKAPKQSQESDVCKTCGKTYNEFLTQGLLGCNDCYDTFKSYLMPIIKTMQYDTKHIGKVINTDSFTSEEESKIKKLEFKLRQAVASENYELASEIKKQISQLKNGGNE